jgi:hypothetical protein
MPADKLHRRRFLLQRLLKAMPLQTGDIMVRMGNDKYYGLPFDTLVGLATKSQFSHASVVLVEQNEIWLVEVDENGTSKQRFLDWIDDVATNDLQVWRPNLAMLPAGAVERLTTSINRFLANDDDYALNFKPDAHHEYCTGSVQAIYEAAGLPALCQPLTALQVLGPLLYYSVFLPVNFMMKLVGASIPLDQGLVFVGNQKQGLLSSKFLFKVFEES